MLRPDWELLDRYQAFSAELLRLSILGIAGVGYVVIQIAPRHTDPLEGNLRLRLTFTLIALGVSGGAALGHRFLSSDGMAYFLSYLRKELQEPGGSEAVDQRRLRNRRFKQSGTLLTTSAGCLTIGLGLLAWSFIGLL